MESVLVVEDQPAVRAALVYPLTAVCRVREACSVACALRALHEDPPAVVVLDLHLGEPAAALHVELSARRLPVVLVSGLDADDARAIAARHGWACLSKPTSDQDLLAAVAAALETHTPMIDPTPDPRPSVVPDLPPPPPASTERVPSDAPLHHDPSVARTDLVTRRVLRGLCALLIAALHVWGEMHGHPVSGLTIAVLGALGMGATAIRDAATRRPGATAAGGALLVVLGLGAELGGVSELGTLAATGVAAATALVDRARGAA